MPGSFRRPPIVSDGIAYAFDMSGSLVACALQPRATSVTLAQLPPAAAFTRAALVDLPTFGALRPGPCLLTANPAGVDLIVLATAEVIPLYRPAPATELAVNAQGSAAGFRAIASTGSLYAFPERAAGSSVALTIRSFLPQSPSKYPLLLNGQQVLGPVCCQSLLVLCTETDLGIFDLITETPHRMRLPRTFAPLLARSPGGFSVPPGSVPITAGRSPAGPVAWIAGTENDRAGLLRVELASGTMHFEPSPRGASLSSNPDGSLSLAADEQIAFPGLPRPAQRTGPLQPGFPAVLSSTSLVFFAEERRSGQQNLSRISDGQTEAAHALFEDSLCTDSTCCAPIVCSAGVAVPYMAANSSGPSGLKIALWSPA